MKKVTLLALVAAMLFSACDSGDIQDSDFSVSSKGKTVKMTARISGVSSWGNSNTVALAAFSDQSNYAVVQRALSATTQDGAEVSVVLNNISTSANTVELVISNKLRERIITLTSVNLDDYADNLPTDTIYMNLGNMDVSLFGCMQNGIFNKACVQCHGANGRTAGSLDLTEGNAFANLVDVEARSSIAGQGYVRVKSGDPENSLLRMLLNEGGENLLHYNHTEVLSSQFKNNLSAVKKLIDDWIASLK